MLENIKNIFRNKSNPNPVFIHIPKTGGTYLSHDIEGEKVLYPMNYLNHVYIVNSDKEKNPLYEFTTPKLAKQTIYFKKNLKNVKTFSVVRNPFDFFVSYLGHVGGWNKKYLNEQHYDYQNAQKGFEYLLKTIANREDVWPNRKMIHFQMFSSDGSLVVDRLNRNETLDKDVEEMAAMWNMNYKKLPRQRVNPRKHYSEYYTKELIDLVSEVWESELNLLGYSFEGSDFMNAVLKKDISEFDKSNVQYNLQDNILTIVS